MNCAIRRKASKDSEMLGQILAGTLKKTLKQAFNLHIEAKLKPCYCLLIRDTSVETFSPSARRSGRRASALSTFEPVRTVKFNGIRNELHYTLTVDFISSAFSHIIFARASRSELPLGRVLAGKEPINACRNTASD